MNRWLSLVLCLVSLVAVAEIYKSVDEHGNVIYSDTPQPGAKKIELPPVPTYTPSPPPQPTPPISKGRAVGATYTSLRITQPQPNATIRDNTGTLAVGAESIPALDTLAGHKLVVELDGRQLDSSQVGRIRLENIDRGAHTLRVSIVDANGRTLISSDAVTFYMMRASILQHPDQQPQDKEGGDTGNGNGDNGGTAESTNPNALSDNPNKRTDNPNVLSPNPNLPGGPPPATNP